MRPRAVQRQTLSLSVVTPLNMQGSSKYSYYIWYLDFGRILALVNPTEALLPVCQGQIFASLVLQRFEDE